MISPVQIGLCGAAAVAAMLVAAAPCQALSERDAGVVNQKMNKAVFIETFAQSGLRNLESRPPAVACRDLRGAKSDLVAAAKLSREALAIIGPDMLGEYKTQRDKLNSMIKIDVDSDAALAECTRKGL